MYVIMYRFLTYLDYVLFISSNSVSTTELYCFGFYSLLVLPFNILFKNFFLQFIFKKYQNNFSI